MGRRRGGEEKSCDDTNEKTLTVISMRLSGLKSSKKRMDITVKLGVARSKQGLQKWGTDASSFLVKNTRGKFDAYVVGCLLIRIEKCDNERLDPILFAILFV